VNNKTIKKRMNSKGVPDGIPKSLCFMHHLLCLTEKKIFKTKNRPFMYFGEE
jgi:hypothetical protein